MAGKHCVLPSRAYVSPRLSASEPLPSGTPRKRSAGLTLLSICGVLTCMVLAIIVARLVNGGPIAPLSIILPVAGLAWLAWLGIKVLRMAPPAEPPARSERPSRRVPRFEPASGARSDRASDSGRHVSA